MVGQTQASHLQKKGLQSLLFSSSKRMILSAHVNHAVYLLEYSSLLPLLSMLPLLPLLLLLLLFLVWFGALIRASQILVLAPTWLAVFSVLHVLIKYKRISSITTFLYAKFSTAGMIIIAFFFPVLANHSMLFPHSLSKCCRCECEY